VGVAEKAIIAFGRYLKTLRERRGLSLDDVAALTKAYPEPINKGYLSRAERGLSHIAFSKIVALGRAYEISIDVFGEKLSLDLEVDQLKNPPETEGKTFEALLSEGGDLSKRGLRLQAYAVYREILPIAHATPVASIYRDLHEQIAAVTASHGIVAGSLGRIRLSRHEVEHALSLNALGPEYLPAPSIHLAVVNRRLGDFAAARTFADRAITEATNAPSQKFLGDALAARALLAEVEGEVSVSIELYKRAYAFFRSLHRLPECARTMSNLANAYFHAGRLGASRRSLGVAYRIATDASVDGIRARVQILLGEIEATEGRQQKARGLWLEALEIAKKAHDRVACFKAEFQLFKNALDSGNATAAGAYGRRLNRLWPWIPPDEPEVSEFRALWLQHRPGRRRRVAGSQLPPRA
jgi:tetratricopeptide (TPR) repeat protein